MKTLGYEKYSNSLENYFQKYKEAAKKAEKNMAQGRDTELLNQAKNAVESKSKKGGS